MTADERADLVSRLRQNARSSADDAPGAALLREAATAIEAEAKRAREAELEVARLRAELGYKAPDDNA